MSMPLLNSTVDHCPAPPANPASVGRGYQEGQNAPIGDGTRIQSSIGYTKIPNKLYDHLPFLGEGELKVMLFILRRTAGFGKTHDAISYKQFLEGVRTRDGRQLDQGCIRDKTALSNALASLKAKGLIRVWEQGGNRPNVYAHRLDEATTEDQADSDLQPSSETQCARAHDQGAAVGETVRSGRPSRPRVVGEPDTQKKHDQKTQIQKEVQQQSGAAAKCGNPDVVAALRDVGVSRLVAEDLATRHAAEHVLRQVDMLDFRPVRTNPAGALVRAIEDNWAPPPGYVPADERVRCELLELEEELAWRWQVEREQRERDQAAREEWRACVCTARAIDPSTLEFWEWTCEEWLPRVLGRRLSERYFGDTLLEISTAGVRVWFRTLQEEHLARVEAPDAVGRALRLVLGREIEVEYSHWEPGSVQVNQPVHDAHTHKELQGSSRGEPEPHRVTEVDARQIWAATRVKLDSVDGAGHYLRGSRLLGRHGEDLVVGVTTVYAAEWLDRCLRERASELLSTLIGERVGVRFVAEAVYRALPAGVEATVEDCMGSTVRCSDGRVAGSGGPALQEGERWQDASEGERLRAGDDVRGNREGALGGSKRRPYPEVRPRAA
ncbi:MAG: replication protein [Chloroflexota bacterium]|nr:replication protein [Chloroflexota bacterium]